MLKKNPVPNLRRKPKDPEGNRSAILSAAIAEFAMRGFSGGRVDAIAKASGCDKQMLYYYFKNKEGLYISALERAYTLIRLSQIDRTMDPEEPLKSLCDLIVSSYDFVLEHPDIIRLIANENNERAEFLKKSALIRKINIPIIGKIDEALRAGIKQGRFRRDVSAVELHQITSSLINHYINNAYTFGYIFDVDLISKNSRSTFRETIAKVVSRYIVIE